MYYKPRHIIMIWMKVSWKSRGSGDTASYTGISDSFIAWANEWLPWLKQELEIRRDIIPQKNHAQHIRTPNGSVPNTLTNQTPPPPEVVTERSQDKHTSHHFPAAIHELDVPQKNLSDTSALWLCSWLSNTFNLLVIKQPIRTGCEWMIDYLTGEA